LPPSNFGYPANISDVPTGPCKILRGVACGYREIIVINSDYTNDQQLIDTQRHWQSPLALPGAF
jgi:hypothetical protein